MADVAYFWLKVLHIASMTVWFTGLFFLPRMFAARHAEEADARVEYFVPVANALFFRITTPAGVATIVFGMGLIAYGPQGAWLVMKLALVTAAVMLHLYFGVVLYEIGHGRDRHGTWFYRLTGWLPLLLLLALAALSAAKPRTVEPLPEPPAHGHSAGGAESSPAASAASRP